MMAFDTKKLYLTFTRNTYEVNATIFASKNINDNIYDPKVHDYIYLPATLERCIVLKEASIMSSSPPYQEDEYHPTSSRNINTW